MGTMPYRAVLARMYQDGLILAGVLTIATASVVHLLRG